MSRRDTKRIEFYAIPEDLYRKMRILALARSRGYDITYDSEKLIAEMKYRSNELGVKYES